MPLYAGKVARLTGTTIKALRIYEHHGLLPAVSRDHNGWRVYRGEHLLRVETIKVLQNAGLSLAQIAQTLKEGKQHTAWQSAEMVLVEQINQAQAKLARLRKLRASAVALSPELEAFKASLLDKGYPPDLAARSIRAGQLLQILLPPKAWQAVMADMNREVAELNAKQLSIAQRYVHLGDCEEGSPAVEDWVRTAVDHVIETGNNQKSNYESWGVDRETDGILSELWETNLSPAQLRANRLLEQRLAELSDAPEGSGAS